MRKNIYLLFDNVDNKTVSYFEAPTFGHVVRNNWRFFQKVNPYFDEDWLCYEIGFVGENGMPVFALDYKSVPWTDYLTPEIQAERLSDSQKTALKSQSSGVTGNPPPEVR